MTEAQEVILEAMAHFAMTKVPESDGLPIELYTLFSDTLVPKLLALYQAIFEASTLPDSLQEALIVLIPKPQKDPHNLSHRDLSPYCKIISKY